MLAQVQELWVGRREQISVTKIMVMVMVIRTIEEIDKETERIFYKTRQTSTSRRQAFICLMAVFAKTQLIRVDLI